ncbi:helix-turn-helix domain-containing protein [Brevibacillus sp. NPDC058079]|uniref:helix-turn-helix domain-containing protein n=1 Tax=Brevibacillus sp. NPDC058079 TaxID=3346330 RepID=UPI0036E6845A
MEMNIHEYIQQCRIEQKLSIQVLSKMSGVSASHISRIERANRRPSPETLEKLAPYLQIEYVKLLEVANLLEKKEKQVIHLEDVLNHPKLFFKGQIIDDQLRNHLLRSIA